MAGMLVLCAAQLAAEKQAPVEIKFAKGTSAVDIPIETPDNLIFLKCTLNGSEPLWFILDTGASFNLINLGHAQRLGVELGQPTKSEKTGMPYVPVKNFKLGLQGVEITGLPANAAPIDQLSFVPGREIAGILGYDFIKQFVVEVDYAKNRLYLFDPKSYVYKGKERPLSMPLHEKWPVIEATVAQEGKGSLTGKLVIDTGSLMALSLVSDKLAGKCVASSGVGISGMSSGQQGRVSSLALGKFKLGKPIAGFPPPGGEELDPLSAAIAEAGMGLVGGEVLHRFKLIIDYSRQTLVLESNKYLKDPFEMDMSGLMLFAMGEKYDQYVVFNVAEGSPAAGAGLQAQDVITAEAGRPASDYPIAKLRAMFRKQGKKHLIKVQRGEETFEREIKLERMI